MYSSLELEKRTRISCTLLLLIGVASARLIRLKPTYIFLKAVWVPYNYCIVLRLLTVKPTYFLLSLSIFSCHATPMLLLRIIADQRGAGHIREFLCTSVGLHGVPAAALVRQRNLPLIPQCTRRLSYQLRTSVNISSVELSAPHPFRCAPVPSGLRRRRRRSAGVSGSPTCSWCRCSASRATRCCSTPSSARRTPTTPTRSPLCSQWWVTATDGVSHKRTSTSKQSYGVLFIIVWIRIENSIFPFVLSYCTYIYILQLYLLNKC